MLIVTEETCQKIMSASDAYLAVESVFAAMASGEAYNFPVIREAIGYADALYGFKSGFDRAGLSLGLKSGGYWPGNAEKGLTNHQSTIFLFDPNTGKLNALVGGNYLTAIRTAASSAVSINHLARPDANTLGMVGAGHQSTFQLKAALEQRKFEKVLAWNKNPDQLPKLALIAEEYNLEFQAAEREELAEQSDVIITITSAHEPLLMSNWIRPGTHIACMGTDTAGKQELDPELIANAILFTDEIEQSITIGETQHAFNQGSIRKEDITPIGDVINSTHPGRINSQQITIFDGTGVGLQDLAVANQVSKLAEQQGLAQAVEL